MSTLLLGTTDWQRHMTPPDAPEAPIPPEFDTVGFCDWMSRKAFRATVPDLSAMRTDRDSIEQWADEAPVYALVAGLLHPNADVRSMAATYLREQWMEAA